MKIKQKWNLKYFLIKSASVFKISQKIDLDTDENEIEEISEQYIQRKTKTTGKPKQDKSVLDMNNIEDDDFEKY